MSRLLAAVDLLPLAGRRTGVGRLCVGLAAALAARDDVEVRGYAIARHARGDVEVAARELGIDGLRAWAVPTRVANRWWRLAPLPPAEWLVGDVDVVHGTNFSVPPTRRAARVVTVHDLTALHRPALCSPAAREYPALVRRALQTGAFAHVCSAYVAAELCEHLGASPERVRVVPPGLDIAGDQPPGRPARSRPYVLALGAVEPRKDLPTLVAAFAGLAAAHLDLDLVIAGPTGPAEEALGSSVRSHGLEDRVVRLGYLGEAERVALLGGASVFAYPSLDEGFGFPPLEAMAAGTPVVAALAGALPEVLGDAAVLVPPGDTGAWQAALESLLDDEGRRRALAAAGRARAGRYRWAGCGEAMVALYRDAVAARSSARGPRAGRGGPGGRGRPTTVPAMKGFAAVTTVVLIAVAIGGGIVAATWKPPVYGPAWGRFERAVPRHRAQRLEDVPERAGRHRRLRLLGPGSHTAEDRRAGRHVPEGRPVLRHLRRQAAGAAAGEGAVGDRGQRHERRRLVEALPLVGRAGDLRRRVRRDGHQRRPRLVGGRRRGAVGQPAGPELHRVVRAAALSAPARTLRRPVVVRRTPRAVLRAQASSS